MIAVDPGLQHCGIACFDNDKLIWAGLASSEMTTRDALEDRVYSVVRAVSAIGGRPVVIELPQFYDNHASKENVDHNDLIKLAAVVGALVYAFEGGVKLVRPHDWKGSMPKDVCHSRIMKRLSPAEAKSIEKCAASLMHNVLDAVGIGMNELGRLK